ncbi:S9 family peptidase [Shewanella surugensis]|uniref:Prolyl oligopeptidase family serine peptidase n=1 Tax=Shewanella surugensis TaxID=212020 RepID=A0ABT0LF22_9GAMM|nr:prolyl oligopeptidase family serine peptidase [Shewanella surugensis]MCL1126159.1 prolyl oligopeptidase family serine peptidase [Shewanella surugensis]
MNRLLRQTGLSVLALSVLASCASIPSSEQTSTLTPPAVKPVLFPMPLVVSTALTLKQIMANPDWMGILARNAYWNDDGQSVYFSRQAHEAAIKQYYQQSVAGEPAVELSLEQLHLASQAKGIFDLSRSNKAYIYQGNVFIKNVTTQAVRQLTKQNTTVEGIRFLNNGDLAFWQDTQVFRIHLKTGLLEQIANIKMAEKPVAFEAKTYIAKQQDRLIEFVALNNQQAKDKKEYQQQLDKMDPTLTARAWYLGEAEKIQTLSLSPDGRYIILSLIDKNYDYDFGGENSTGIMAKFISQKGPVEAKSVRALISEDTPPGERFVLLNLTNHTQKPINIEGLTGYDDDVFADIRRENTQVKGQSYQATKMPRKFELIKDWSRTQSPIQWQMGEDQVALMIEAIDNKDRWIATLDLSSGDLHTQHKLHDDAWVNYFHNQFGWLPNTQTLYYLSEQTGYSQLYTKSLDGTEKALTQGEFVVSDITVGPKAQYIYYKANKVHPGIDNVYRVDVNTGKSEQLTHWKGRLNYKLSPEGRRLLLTASKTLQPSELYIQNIGGELKQLTHYTSQSFKDYAWQAPMVVKVPSSHGANDIYARVYLPEGFNKDNAKQYPAVMFNHGAGYLQNAHFGFSVYFREFMFHNLLAQQGYVVMDMDYRGSAGYGRDWRTAVYRQMGHPEVEDLQDGVNWMVNHANVKVNKVGTYGGSYGGFLTFMALFTEPELFQAGAALRPVTDWVYYNQPYVSNVLNMPQVDPIAFERSSPIEWAQGLEKPLLIMTGMVDDNVFFQDSVRLVQRLIELEKPMFETAIYPVEPHGFRQPSSWLDEYRRIFKLFETQLK